jgi:undecaprenyl-diphosphatase
VATDDPAGDPLVAAASPAGWRAWAEAARGRLAALGLTLVAGFLAGLLALYLFARLADDVLERETEWLDGAVLVWLRGFASPWLDGAARFASFLGSETVAVLLVALVVALVARRRWGAAVGLLLATAGAQALNNVLKELFQRTRPAPVAGLIPAQTFSFPSGHAMVAAAFYGFLAYLAWRALRGRRRGLATAGLLLLIGLIGLSRLYLGVHYLTDVAAGYLAGFVWLDVVILGGRLLRRRR